MRLRGRIKHFLYGALGSFSYFGHTVFFPPRSHIFARACEEGTYERETANLLDSLVKPHTTFIDIGANIGLLSIPVLVKNTNVHVVSIEASPHTARHLKRTWEQSAHRDRWRVVETAVGRTTGEAVFWVSAAENGAFDGLSDTGRGGRKQSLTVDVQTLDKLWLDWQRPPISVVKIDVEGGERDVLAGCKEMLAEERPALVIEWSRLNLPAYGIRPGDLLDICRDVGYQAYAHPNLSLIKSEALLEAAMAQTETFLLLPVAG